VGRFRPVRIPIELVGDLRDCVTDRIENLADLLGTDGGLGPQEKDEMREDIKRLEMVLTFLEE
jgi:hypothetical protein